MLIDVYLSVCTRMVVLRLSRTNNTHAKFANTVASGNEFLHFPRTDTRTYSDTRGQGTKRRGHRGVCLCNTQKLIHRADAVRSRFIQAWLFCAKFLFLSWAALSHVGILT